MSARVKESIESRTPADYLRLALGAQNAVGRARYARLGLALDDIEEDPETQVLLLRQLYLSHMDSRRFAAAAEVATQMAAIGPLRDIAHHDRSRAEAARGETDTAILAQRSACRAAPPDRRSFQWWSLATLQHFADDHDGALRSLKHAERWAHRDRPLIRAHRAHVMLDQKRMPHELDRIISDLGKSPAREGYGQYLLGMIAHQLGDPRRAAVHLRAYLRRNAAADAAKTATLAEEFRRARKVLASIESD